MTRPNQVWATNITYIPVAGGFVYLCAVIDWHRRYVLAWELSNLFDASFCVRAVRRAITAHGVPEIFNTDQGCQFTSAEFTQPLLELGVRLSMDDKGRCLDNVFVERLWRSPKHEEVYLKHHESVVDAHAQIGTYLAFYNDRRPHSAQPVQPTATTSATPCILPPARASGGPLRPRGAKDDGPDAEMILALLRQHRDRLTPFMPDTPAARKLAALIEQLISLLKRVYPQALSLAVDDLGAPMAIAFLRRFPSLCAAKKAVAARLREFYRRHNVRSVESIEERARLVASARPITRDEAILRPAALELERLLDLLAVLARHITAYQEEIARAFAARPKAEIFASLPGAGALLALFGERAQRYPDAASLQKYAGIAPVCERSQGRLWVHWRWAAPKFLLQPLVEWAGQTVQRCTWAKEHYLRQKAAGKGHHAILGSLAFKWVRILWRCWKDHVPYDEAHYLAALAKRCSPLPHAA